jgi:hypothetical protein
MTPPPVWLNRGPLWIRVHAYAAAHQEHGHTRLTAGELQQALGPTTPGSISRAISTAVAGGWLSPISSARCLVLPGYEMHLCPAIHRGDT